MKDKRGKIKNSRRGAILVIAVVIVVILLFIGIGLLQLGSNARMQGVKDVLQISARSAADAGIEHAVRYMINSWETATNKDNWVTSWNDPNAATPNYSFGPVSLGGTFGEASFTYKIYKGTRPAGYRIDSTGTAGRVTRIVHAAVVLRSVFFGIGAKRDIYLSPGKLTLGTVPANDTLIIQTNSIEDDAITLMPKLTIPGDVVVGPGGDTVTAIDFKPNVTIVPPSEARAAEDYIDFPPVYRPTGLPVGTPTPVGSDYRINGDIQINGGFSTSKILYIGDPNAVNKGLIKVYVAGPTNLNSGSKLIVNAGYSLELYLGGNMYTAPTSAISYTTTPPTTDAQIIDAAKRISIKGTTNPANGVADCTSILFQPNGNFYGAIYAPDADPLKMMPGGDFYGAIVGADNVTLKPGGKYMYIPSLVDINDVEVLYMGIKHGSWWEE